MNNGTAHSHSHTHPATVQVRLTEPKMSACLKYQGQLLRATAATLLSSCVAPLSRAGRDIKCYKDRLRNRMMKCLVNRMLKPRCVTGRTGTFSMHLVRLGLPHTSVHGGISCQRDLLASFNKRRHCNPLTYDTVSACTTRLEVSFISVSLRGTSLKPLLSRLWVQEYLLNNWMQLFIAVKTITQGRQTKLTITLVWAPPRELACKRCPGPSLRSRVSVICL